MQKFAIIAALLLALFIVLHFLPPGYQSSAKKYKQYVQTNQPTFDAIAKWSEGVKITPPDSPTEFVSIPPQDWPRELQTLAYGRHAHPAYVNIRAQPRAVWITYGGGLGHWGLIMDVAKSGQLDQFQKDFLLRVNARDLVWWELQD